MINLEKKSLKQCYADECNNIIKEIKDSGITEKGKNIFKDKCIDILVKLELVELKTEKTCIFSELGKCINFNDFVITIDDIFEKNKKNRI